MKKVVFILALSFISFSVFSQTKNNNNQQTTYEGVFSSVKGVMNPLSCLCYNSGYLTLDIGEEIMVCFRNEDLNVDCERIVIYGHWEVVDYSASSDNPCPSMNNVDVFYADRFECVE